VRATPCCACLCLVGLLPLAAAEGPAGKKAQPQAPSVAQLIRQLGDEDFRARDQAMRALEALGPQALPEMRKALPNEDAEIARRLAALIPRMETAARLTPKRVTLKASQQPLQKIVQELAKQSGYPIDFWGGGNLERRYDLQLDNVTFWEAFDRIDQLAGLVPQSGYGDDRLRVQHQDTVTPHVCRDGCFRAVAGSLQQYRVMDLSSFPRSAPGPRRSESLTFSFTVWAEPKLPLMGIGEPKVVAAVDEAGRSMAPAQPDDAPDGPPFLRRVHVSRYGNGYRSLSQQGSVALVRPSEKSRSIKRLKVSVPVTILAEQRLEVVAADVMKAKGKKAAVGTTTFSIEDVTVTPNKQYQLKMTVAEDNKDSPNDYSWMNSLYNRVELRDEKGNKYQAYGSSWGNSGPNLVHLTLTYGPPGNVANMGPPKKLVYHVWKLMPHQVTFEFKDLPLP